MTEIKKVYSLGELYDHLTDIVNTNDFNSFHENLDHTCDMITGCKISCSIEYLSEENMQEFRKEFIRPIVCYLLDIKVSSNENDRWFRYYQKVRKLCRNAVDFLDRCKEQS